MSAPEVGAVVAERTVPLDRGSLVRYAGASGDFNPIHYRDDVAEAVGLPGVLAHGMLTMGVAVQPVVDWLESIADPGQAPGWVTDYQVRFTRPVVVPALGRHDLLGLRRVVGVVVHPEDGAELTIVATLAQVDDDGLAGRVDLTVSTEGRTVLGKAQVRVAFA